MSLGIDDYLPEHLLVGGLWWTPLSAAVVGTVKILLGCTDGDVQYERGGLPGVKGSCGQSDRGVVAYRVHARRLPERRISVVHVQVVCTALVKVYDAVVALKRVRRNT